MPVSTLTMWTLDSGFIEHISSHGVLSHIPMDIVLPSINVIVVAKVTLL